MFFVSESAPFLCLADPLPLRKWRRRTPNCAPHTFMIMLSPSLNLPPSPGPRSRDKRAGNSRRSSKPEEMTMAWTTPVIVEVCVGMEVTAYSSAEI
ncbi:MAG: pyrroloquinoline quinone precursor peptide PqqA [Methylocystis sp.]|nr:MAG: pyrroloquinoline quinone precursor peptide PqqA [Methylocystis sp.]